MSKKMIFPGEFFEFYIDRNKTFPYVASQQDLLINHDQKLIPVMQLK